MRKLLATVFLVVGCGLFGGCSAENVHNTAPRTDEDNAYIQQMDDEVAAEEQGS